MSNNVSGTSGTSRTCSTRDDDDDRVRNEEQATLHAQRLVNALSPNRLKESGKGDAETERALKAFQNDHGLSPTGKADGATLAKLEAAVHAQDAHEHGAEEPAARTAHTKTDGIGGAPQYVGREVTYQGRPSHASPTTKPAAAPETGANETSTGPGRAPVGASEQHAGSGGVRGSLKRAAGAEGGGLASNIHEKRDRVVGQIREKTATIREGVDAARKAVETGAQKGVAAAKAAGEKFLDKINPLHQIATLEKGDIYSLGISASFSAPVEPGMKAGAGTRSGITVKREESGYTVEASGAEALQGSAAVSHTATLSVEASLGAKVTFHADTKEEALRLAKLSAQAGFEMGSVAGKEVLKYTGHALNADDKKFLAEHCTAVTVTGGEAAKFLAETGSTKEFFNAGVEGKLEGTVSESVTLKMDHGKVSEVVVEGDMTVAASARAAAGLAKPGTPDAEGKTEFKLVGPSTSVGLEGGAEVHVKVSKHFVLKPGASVDSVLHSPEKSLKKAVMSQVASTHIDVSLTVDGSVSANAGPLEKGAGVSFSATVSNVAVNSKMLKELGTGNVKGALEAIPETTEVEVKTGTFEKQTLINQSHTAQLPVVGNDGPTGTGTLTATRRHDEEGSTYKAPAGKLAMQGWNFATKAGPPKHTHLDTNVQDQRYARVAG
jgi:hypothetical protein